MQLLSQTRWSKKEKKKTNKTLCNSNCYCLPWVHQSLLWLDFTIYRNEGIWDTAARHFWIVGPWRFSHRVPKYNWSLALKEKQKQSFHENGGYRWDSCNLSHRRSPSDWRTFFFFLKFSMAEFDLIKLDWVLFVGCCYLTCDLFF